jgi:hypothetical protein
MIKEASTLCAWCGRPFQERQTGGRTQRFCRPSCRRSFHAAVRSWALDAIADGTLTLAEVRSGAVATRALLPTAISPAPVGEVPRQLSAPVVPRVDSRYAQQEFERLLARTIADRRR